MPTWLYSLHYITLHYITFFYITFITLYTSRLFWYNQVLKRHFLKRMFINTKFRGKAVIEFTCDQGIRPRSWRWRELIKFEFISHLTLNLEIIMLFYNTEPIMFWRVNIHITLSYLFIYLIMNSLGILCGIIFFVFLWHHISMDPNASLN